jgi:hypothetical protein
LQWESKLKELDIKEEEEKIALKKKVRFILGSTTLSAIKKL